jgi:hypothetical protein
MKSKLLTLLRRRGISLPVVPNYLSSVDTGSANAAYMLKYSPDYAGASMRIRRASDSAETNIGFKTYTALDGSAFEYVSDAEIEAFCTGTTCACTEVYDTTGNLNHVFQATAANQPPVYQSGAVVKIGGFPALFGDGVSTRLQHDSTETAKTDEATIVAVSQHNVGTESRLVGYSGYYEGFPGKNTFAQDADSNLRFDGAFAAGSYGSLENLLHIRFSFKSLTHAKDWINNTSNIDTAITLPGTTLNYCLLQVQDNPDSLINFGSGVQGAAVFYNSDRQTERVAIQDYLNNIYGGLY